MVVGRGSGRGSWNHRTPALTHARSSFPVPPPLPPARLQLALVLCLPSLGNNALAASTIPRIDPPSEGILMERFIPLSLDACLGEVVLFASGAEQVRQTHARLIPSPPALHFLHQADQRHRRSFVSTHSTDLTPNHSQPLEVSGWPARRTSGA